MRNDRGQFLPGHSGNANGRPKNGFSIPDILRKIGDEIVSDEEKISKLEAMCRKAWEQAIAGDRRARAWIADRMEGTAKQVIHIEQHGRDRVVVIND